MPLRFEVIAHADDLRGLAAEWETLVERSSAPALSVTPVWLMTWWETFGGLDGRELRVAAAYDHGHLVGLAPFVSRRYWHRSAIPFRRLELLGSGEPEADEICSDYLAILSERGHEPAIAAGLSKLLFTNAFGSWDELILPSMNGETPMPELLASCFRAEGFDVATDCATESPYIPLATSWAGYLQELSSSQRYRIRRTLRDFEQWADGSGHVQSASTPQELETGLTVLRELHAERWRGDGRSGVFASERFSAFHRRIAGKLLDRGQLDLLWLSAHGAPIAALYNFVYAGKVAFYQSGRSVSLPEECGVRPGAALHAYAIQRAIEMGRREYDFLPGPSRYKMGFALKKRPIVTLRATRRGAREEARRWVEAGLGAAKHQLQRHFRAGD